jgi:hypothetical protein
LSAGVLHPGRLGLVAFGDLEGGLWGVAVNLDDEAVLVLGGGAGGSVTELSGGDWDGDGGWRLRAPGVDLVVEPHGDAIPSDTEELVNRQELCRIRGTLSIDDTPEPVDCVAVRAQLQGVASAAFSSARVVAGWVTDDEAFALTSLRARTGRGHDGDCVAATLFTPEGRTPVSDPRLSTTYDRAGVPARMSLELWLGEGEQEYPRRAAGEATGAGGEAQLGDVGVRVIALRCHSRGGDGAGAYVLLSAR